MSCYLRLQEEDPRRILPRPCVAPVLDFEELCDDKEVVLGVSGGILLVPKTSFKIDRF